MSQSLTPRGLYHAIRRASSRQGYKISDRYHVTTKSDLARLTREQIGRLPNGMRPIFERLIDAVLAAHRTAAPPSLTHRYHLHLAEQVRREAERRGLPIWVDLARNADRRVEYHSSAVSGGRRVVLLVASGWADYGRSTRGAEKTLCVLGGVDDAGPWAVRVPGTVANATGALDWLMPASVRNAASEGRRVLRQGDVWVIERSRDAMGTGMPSGHQWDAATRTLTHGGHAPLSVQFPAVAVAQSTLAAGGGRRRGD